MRCPVCGNEKIEDIFDVCENCFFEYNEEQIENPDLCECGNALSLNNYKAQWHKLINLMPELIDKYEIKKGKGLGNWTYSNLAVSRSQIKNFIAELTKNNIPVRLSFYNVCYKYRFNDLTFVGFPYVNAKSVAENNQKNIDIIFTDEPLIICKEYGLKQLGKLLKKSKNVYQAWQELTPLIDVDMQWTIEELGGFI